MPGKSETSQVGLHRFQAEVISKALEWLQDSGCGDMILGLFLWLQQDENPGHQGMRDKCQPFPGPLDRKSDANYGRDLR